MIQGTCDGFSLLDASDHNYDMEKGYTRHTISSKIDENGIIVELNGVFIINYIKILLWDLDNRVRLLQPINFDLNSWYAC